MTDSLGEALSPHVEAVRKRPGMFVADGLFAFINYLVCPFSLLLARGPARISVTVDDAFRIEADKPISVTEADDLIAPFEVIKANPQGHGFRC